MYTVKLNYAHSIIQTELKFLYLLVVSERFCIINEQLLLVIDINKPFKSIYHKTVILSLPSSSLVFYKWFEQKFVLIIYSEMIRHAHINSLLTLFVLSFCWLNRSRNAIGVVCLKVMKSYHIHTILSSRPVLVSISFVIT